MTQPISNRVYRQFYSALGFDENPFAYTNADQEERLLDYFVPPPYFPAVFGDPDRPQSFVVFAPRGGGKSAQRRKMESSCADNNVLAITYDRFEFPGIQRASDVTLAHHLRILLRYSLMGLLVTLNANPDLKEKLNKHERQTIIKLAAEYLDAINEFTVQNTLDSLKSLQDKAKQFWNDWLPAIGPAFKALFKKLLDVDLGSLAEYKDPAFSKGESLKSQLGLMVELAKKIGYKSIYFLIDRVDESELTGNDAIASFRMLEPLLRDLELLETRGVGFKFFLWDRLEPPYQEIARTDRIRQETLEWDNHMLRSLWQKRLRAFSLQKVGGLEEIGESTKPFSPDELALIFANRSPRDMIRIGSQIMVEQQEINLNGMCQAFETTGCGV
jgi:hypothetical protein